MFMWKQPKSNFRNSSGKHTFTRLTKAIAKENNNIQKIECWLIAIIYSID